MLARGLELVVLLAMLAPGMTNEHIKVETAQFKLSEFCWRIIVWFYEQNNFVDVTRISQSVGGSKTNDFPHGIISGLALKTNKPIHTSHVDLSMEEEVLTYAEKFSWQGVKFEPRDTQLHPDSATRHKFRSNGSDFGSFVVAESLGVLSDFVEGSPRHPFLCPTRRFVIVIHLGKDDFWQETADTILSKLWRNYGILWAFMLIVTKEEELFGRFDPFSRYEYLNATELLRRDMWGTTKWYNVADVSEETIKNIWPVDSPSNFNGYPIISTLFSRYPTALSENEMIESLKSNYFSKWLSNSGGFGGLDGIVLANLARALNYTSIVTNALDNKSYGWKLDNGTFCGSIGDVLYHYSDISFNGRFIKDYETDEIDYSAPTFSDKFCIVAPKSLQIPQWMALFRCFNPKVWVIIIVVNTACGYIWYLLKRWALHKSRSYNAENGKWNKNNGNIHDRLSVAMIEMWMVLLMSAATRSPYRPVERLFFGVCLLANIIIAGSFQGSLTTSYSTVSYYKDIDTLEELDQSGLHIGTSSKSVADILGDDMTSPVIRSLTSKLHVWTSLVRIPTLDQAAFFRDMCGIEREADLNIIIAAYYENSEGKQLLHKIKECPRVYYLSYIVKRGSPFLKSFNSVIMKLVEAGITDEWYSFVEYVIMVHERYKRRATGTKLHTFSLVDMQTAFYFLGIGLGVCCVVLCIEIIIAKRRKY